MKKTVQTNAIIREILKLFAALPPLILMMAAIFSTAVRADLMTSDTTVTTRKTVSANSELVYDLIDSGELVITMDNSASRGAAIATNNPNAVFTATASAGGVIKFEGNVATVGTGFSGGGAIYANTGATINVSAVLFTSNTATNRCGGAIVAFDFVTINTGNAVFTGNYAGAFGGAIAAATNSSINADGAGFNGNIAGTSGGAIYINTSSTLSADGITFTSNTAATTSASNGGGAIYSGNNSNIYITSGTFVENKQTGNSSPSIGGGAMYITKATATMVSSAFNGNVASGQGGAVYASTGANITIRDSWFSSNTASGNGGGMYNWGAAIFVENSQFEGNKAGTSGGAVSATATGTTTLTNVNFIGNTAASGNGGAVYATDATVNINVTSGDSIYKNNTAGGVANSIHLQKASALAVDIAAGSVLDMWDPMTAQAGSGITLTITQTNAGIWKLGGATLFSGAGIFNFKVFDGTLHLYRANEPGADTVEAGSLAQATGGLNFTLGSGATLSLGGGNAITASAITFEAGSIISYDLAQVNAATGTALLTLTAPALGIFTDASQNAFNFTIDLSTWTSGSFNLLSVGAGNLSGFDAAALTTLADTLTYDGSAVLPAGYKAASLELKGDNLWLILESIVNRVLTWTGATDGNFENQNWSASDAVSTTFNSGDLVNLAGGSANNTIALATTATLAAIYVSGDQSYAITGAGALVTDTDVEATTLSGSAAATGRLVLGQIVDAGAVTASAAAFTGVFDLSGQGAGARNTFAGGVDIYSGALRISSTGQLGTTLSQLGFLGTPATTTGTLIVAENSSLAFDGAGGATQRLVIEAGKSAAIALESGASLAFANASGDQGAALNVNNNALLNLAAADGAVFLFNSNTGNWGGAMYVGIGSTVTIDSARFENNRGIGGGALYNRGAFTGADLVFVSNTVNNSSRGGGAIYNDGTVGTPLVLVSSTFIGNATDGEGGAIFNYNGGGFTGTNLVFANNASAGGGAIYTDGDLLEIVSSTFTGNHAATRGGAIYTTGTRLDIGTDTVFSGNSAASGGALALAGPVNLNASGAEFTGNTASINAVNNATAAGGAIFAENAWNATINIQSAVFTSNTASISGDDAYADGGAIYVEYASLDARAAAFAGNTAIVQGADSAASGGAISASDASVDARGATFTGNTARASGANAVVAGGAINYFSDSAAAESILDVTDATFTGNAAISADSFATGGAILIGSGTLKLGATAGVTSLYSGNTMQGDNTGGIAVANSIALWNAWGGITALVDVADTGLLDMRDAMSGGYDTDILNDTPEPGDIAITKTGGGEWRLSGSSILDGSQYAASALTPNVHTVAFAVNEGALLLAQGAAIKADAVTSTFTLGATATLSLGGANAISASALNFNNGSTIRFAGASGAGDTLALAGDATFTGATIQARLGAAAGFSDLVEIDGAAAFLATTSTIAINHTGAFTTGTYTLLAADSINYNSLTLALTGFDGFSARQTAALIQNTATLDLVLNVLNKNIIWTNLAGDYAWNTTSTNWSFTDAPASSDAYLAGDHATFTTGTGTITVNGRVDVAGMSVTGGTLAFTGGTIAGTAVTTLTATGDTTQKLAIAAAANVTLASAIDFANGLENAGLLTLADSGSIAAAMSITNTGTLAINRAADHTLASTVAGTGDLVKAGAGVLTLTATNTHTGLTRVTDGELVNAGNILNSDVTVTGGLFTNTGTLFATLANNAAAANSGRITGLVTNTGTLANAAGGALDVLVQVGGTATNAGLVTTATLNGGGLANNGGNIATLVQTAGAAANSGLVSTATLTATGALVNSATIAALAQTGGAMTNAVTGTITLAATTGNLANAGAIDQLAQTAGYVSNTGLVASALVNGGTLANTGTLLTSATIGSAGALLFNGGTMLSAITNNGALTYANAAAYTQSAAIAGAGAIAKTGAGDLTLAALVEAAALDIAAGKLTVAGTGTLSLTGALNIAATSTLGIAIGSGTSVIAGSVNFNDTGTLDITGYTVVASSSYAAPTDVARTVIHTTGGGILGFSSSNVTILDQTSVDYLKVSATATAADIIIDTVLAWNLADGAAHGTFDISSATFTIAATLADNTGAHPGWDGKSLTKLGAGTLVLSASNAHTGTTTINAGILENTGCLAGALVNVVAGELVNSGTIATAITNAATTTNTGRITGLATNAALFANNALGNITGTLANTGTLINATGAQLAMLVQTGGTATSAGVIATATISGGGLANTGTLTTLAQQNGAATNAGLVTTAVQTGGLLTNAAAGAIATATVTGGTLANTGGAITVAATIGANGTLLFNSGAMLAAITNDGRLSFANAAAHTQSNAITGAGAIAKTGAGDLNIAALVENTALDIAAGKLTVVETGTLALTGSLNIGASSTLGIVIGTGTSVVAGSINFNDTGVLDITGYAVAATSTYPFDPAVARTVIHTTGNSILGFNAANVTISGATEVDYLKVSAFATAADIIIDTMLSWNLADGTAHGNVTIASGQTFTIDAALVGNTAAHPGWDGASLTKLGEGTLVLAGANTFTGTTTLATGTLANTGVIAGALVNVTAGAALINTGTITAATLVNNASATNSGLIESALTNNAALVNAATGTLASLAQAAGTTTNAGLVTTATITGGALANNAGATIAALNQTGGSVTNAGLITTATTTGALANTTGTIATLAQTAGLVTNNAAITTAATIAGGTLANTGGVITAAATIGANGALLFNSGSLAAPITNNGALTFANASDYTLDQTVSGAGVLNKNGAGDLVIAVAQTYTGATNITAGALRLAADNALAASSRVSLAPGATLDLGGRGQNIKTLAAADASRVVFNSAGANYATLTLATLTGGGTFAMRVDGPAGHDTLVVTGNDSTGAHTIDITLGGALRDPVPLVEISADSAATFHGEAEHNLDLYTIEQADNGQWRLSTGGVSDTGDVILSTAGVIGMDWHYSLDSVHLRMGDLRSMPAAGRGSVWMRTGGYRLNGSPNLPGDTFRQHTWNVTAGADALIGAARESAATFLVGGFLQAGRSDRTYDNFGKSDTDTVGAGLYATALLADGWFADATLKYDRYSNDLDARDANAVSTTADYTAKVLGLSIEAGRRIYLTDSSAASSKTGNRKLVSGASASPPTATPAALQWRYWLEPSVQAASAWVGSADYTARGKADIDVKVKSSNIWQYRAQIRAGANMGKWIPYIKIAGVGSNTSGGEVHADDRVYEVDLDGFRFETGFGAGYLITPASQLYFDYEYNKSSKYERPWAINLGYRLIW